jgi:hypothetical protein
MDDFKRTAPGIDATVLLCDSAQAVGGKLFILGGGWSQVWAAQPITMALAIKLVVPWDLANQRLSLAVRLLTEDGQPVPAPTGSNVEVSWQFEVGRPPGLPPGTGLDATMAIPIQGLPLGPGGYEWRLEVDGEVLRTVPFRVLSGPPPMPIQQ